MLQIVAAMARNDGTSAIESDGVESSRAEQREERVPRRLEGLLSST